jgi:hypothetical protein
MLHETAAPREAVPGPKRTRRWRKPRQLLGAERTRLPLDGAAASDPKRTLRAVDCRIAKGLFTHLIGTGKWLRRHVKAERTVRVDPTLSSSPGITWMDRLSASASRKAEKLRNGAVVGAHRCLVRQADELCGQRKFKASHHGNATTICVLSPISRS